jgi:hypothetical protein
VPRALLVARRESQPGAVEALSIWQPEATPTAGCLRDVSTERLLNPCSDATFTAKAR